MGHLFFFAVCFLGGIPWFGVHAQTIAIPYYQQGGVLEVDVEIFDVQRRFIFDTGASSICLSSELFNDLQSRGQIRPWDIIGRTQCRIADGSLVDGYVLLLGSITVGGHTFRNIEATVISAPTAPLLLGQSFLTKFGKVSVNYQSHQIELERSTQIASNPVIDEIRLIPCDILNISNASIIRNILISSTLRVNSFSQEVNVPPPYKAVSKLREGITIRYFDNSDFRKAEEVKALIQSSTLVSASVPINTENMLPFYNYKPIPSRIEIWLK
jgi:hypothetical protein